MAANDFQYAGWNSYTLQCGMWLWNRDSEFTKWQQLNGPLYSNTVIGTLGRYIRYSDEGRGPTSLDQM